MNHKAEYLEYLKSDHWQSLRSLALKRDGFCCVRCPNRQHLEVHHKLYRLRWEDSVVEDLETLCASCHEREHRKLPESIEIGVAGSVGSRRWNVLGQLVTGNGVPIQAIIRGRNKRFIKRLNKRHKKWKANVYSGKWSC